MGIKQRRLWFELINFKLEVNNEIMYPIFDCSTILQLLNTVRYKSEVLICWVTYDFIEGY